MATLVGLLLALAPHVTAKTAHDTRQHDFVKASLEKYGRNMPDSLLKEIMANNVTREALRMLTVPSKFAITFDGQTIEKDVLFGKDLERARAAEVAPAAAGNVTINPAVIWQIGKAIWDLVKNNKAVVDYTTDWAGAVPENVTDWTQLTEWTTWKSSMYKFEFKNFLGQKLSEFKWKYTCQYGGKYNGAGKYLTLCGASINEIYAYGLYGEQVQVSAKGSKPFNYGTADNPIGGLNLQVVMSSEGHFEKTVVGCQITMKGDSTFTVIQCDQN
eukprot:jgi/Bigna1/88802/estExt_fgenesh1_pg.C_380107